MQGEDASEQVANGKCNVGIDVCEAWLDIHVLPCEEAFRVANTPQGHRSLKRRLKHHEIGVIVIEATGKWHRQIQRSLHASSYAVHVVNPLRARLFAEGINVLAKTDKLDARMLAMMGFMLGNEAKPPDPKIIEELKELVQARASAVAEQTSLRNQSGSAQVAFVRRQLEKRQDRLAKDIKALGSHIMKRIKSDEGLRRRHEILSSIPCFGEVVAMTLLAWLPELGSCNHKQIASLTGLAPWADDSGKREGERHIKGGRTVVRNALYLAALTAARFNPDMQTFYLQLKAKGKDGKLPIIAIARKLVVLANTLISADRIWMPKSPVLA
ncbi:MAG: IS110 family transposase [Hyphomicrobiales bacterium]|nr:IS110 family transposase [Hyphomicrobiales bacterium]